MSPRAGPDRRRSGRTSRTGPSARESRKRYYIFSPDFGDAPGDFLFENQDDVLVEGRRTGRHEHEVPGYRIPFATGLPPLLGKPKLSIGIEVETLSDLYGFKPWFVSTRAAALLSGIDPDGFEFAPCDTFDREGTRLQPYWMMNAVRIVNEFDEERSSFERFVDRNPGSADPSNPAIVALNDIYMSPSLPDSYHSFYFPRYRRNFIVDAAIADGWRNAELRGVVLSPLQPPTESDLGADKETPDYLSFKNYSYWSRKGSLS